MADLDTKSIQHACTAIQTGHLIVYPTDTQYALGCHITNIQGIQQVYNLKKRPKHLPLPIGISDITKLNSIGYVTPTIQKIAQHFLPGPLTLIIKKKQHISNQLTQGKNTIAVRIPNHPITLQLLQTCGPLTITSANIHGQQPHADITSIQQTFKNQISYYLPGGTLHHPPSTILDLTTTTPHIIRPGPITQADIEEALTS